MPMPIGFHELLEKNLSGMDRVKQFLCAIILVKARLKMRDSKLRSQLFKRIENLQAGSAKVFIVAGDDGEVVAAM